MKLLAFPEGELDDWAQEVYLKGLCDATINLFPLRKAGCFFRGWFSATNPDRPDVLRVESQLTDKS